MQFTPPTQQLTTCPQCDNVVRVDEEFCNICGKRLLPASGHLSLQDSEYEDDDEYIDDEEYEDDEDEVSVARSRAQLTPPAPPPPGPW